jgi:hypothetical protein
LGGFHLKEILDAVDKLLRTCLEFFGVNLTVWIIIGTVAFFALWRVYSDWAKRKEVNSTVAAKDHTIQILAEQNRQLRVIQLKNDGWALKDIENFVLKAIPKDPIEAREMLQKSKRGPKKPAS